MQMKARDVCDKELEKIFKQEALVYTQDRTYSATYGLLRFCLLKQSFSRYFYRQVSN